VGVRFELWINGQRMCLAGIDGAGVMSLTMSRVQNSPTDFERLPKRKKSQYSVEEYLSEKVHLSLGGLICSGEQPRDHRHVVWHGQNLKVGDDVRIRVLPDGDIDPYQLWGELPPN
jgi:hypothetical protein